MSDEEPYRLEVKLPEGMEIPSTLGAFDDYLSQAYRDHLMAIDRALTQSIFGPVPEGWVYTPPKVSWYRKVLRRLRYRRRELARRFVWQPLHDFSERRGARCEEEWL